MNICIVEKNINSENCITHEELDKLLTEELKDKYEFDENEFMANCLFFNENYTHKQLTKIADYYKIKKTRKKELLINDIVLFEMEQENKEIDSQIQNVINKCQDLAENVCFLNVLSDCKPKQEY